MEIKTSLLRSVDNPARYFTPLIVKDNPPDPEKSPLRVLIIFPDLPEVGYSHTGIKILYELFMRQGSCTDFVFAYNEDYRKHISPENPHKSVIYGMEVTKFDILCVSFQYQLHYPVFIRMLKDFGLAVKSSERSEKEPLIIAGGPVMCNPEPMAEVFDLIYIGEIEPSAKFIAATMKNNNKSKAVEIMSKQRGFYNPALKNRVKRVITQNPDDGIVVPTKAPVMGLRTVHDRFSIEIQRGCTRGCRYCLAGVFYRPHREKSAADVLFHLKENSFKSGYGEAGFLSLSASDHHNICQMITESFNTSPHGLSVSLPSLRAETINDHIVSILGRGRKGGFTIAPETGSERLRKIINKQMNDESIFRSVDYIMSNGWRSLKLYFMLGLPFEEESDIDKTISFIIEINRIVRKYGKRNKLTVSFSTFVPQPFTPFQWCKMNSPEEIKKKQQKIFEKLKSYRSVKIQWHDTSVSIVEAVLSRAGRYILPALEDVAEEMSGLQSWSENFDMNVWEKAFEKNNISVKKEIGHREQGKPLPYNRIDMGIKEKYLLNELKKSKTGLQTPDCIDGVCSGCGVCDENIKPVRDETSPEANPEPEKQEEYNRKNSYPYFLFFSKTGRASSLGHLDTMNFLIKGCMISGFSLLFSEGHNPRPRIETFDPIPVGVSSLDEHLIVWLTEHIETSEIKRTLNKTFKSTGFVFNKVLKLKPEQVKSRAGTIRKAVDTEYTVIFDMKKDAENFAEQNRNRIISKRDGEIDFIHRRGDGSLWKKIGEPSGEYHLIKKHIIVKPKQF
ncbi:MAG: DUF2344 domain-containing protein [bacterium]